MIKKCSVSIGMLKFLPERVRICAQCYQTDFSSDFLRLGMRLALQPLLEFHFDSAYKGQSHLAKLTTLRSVPLTLDIIA